jgi:hypothetical protein
MDLVKFFFTFQQTIKLYHWQTSSYARHKSADELYLKFIDLADTFIETYQGKYGKIEQGNLKLDVKSFGDNSITDFLDMSKEYLKNIEKESKVKSTDTDLLNIRDELLGEINKTLYLFTFK